MTPNRDEQMARLSLTLDEKERANLLAEHERWERRRRAMKRGDEGSLPYVSQGVCLKCGNNTAIGADRICGRCSARDWLAVPGEHECGPLTFAPIQCTGCGVKLTSQNHGNARQCQRCFEETQALRAFEAARQRLIAENKAALAKAKPGLFRRFLSLFSRGRGRK